jgi:hypothetical protein
METSVDRPNYPHVMIYQVVEGARIQGRARPGATVHLSLRIRSSKRIFAFRYRSETRVRPDGSYEFVVPYATDISSTVSTAESYLLSCGNHSARIAVSEAAVIDGAKLDGPRLRCVPERT